MRTTLESTISKEVSGMILVQLDIHHKIKMSLRTLKRRLKVLGLNKNNATASAAVIKQIIEREIEDPSMLRFIGVCGTN